MVYLTRHPGRLDRDRIESLYPGLIGDLAAHPGIGLVVVDDATGPVAIGGSGWHRLTDGAVGGTDPLLPYGPCARDDLLRHQRMQHLGDLVLISLVDPETEEVAAFEELVGSHGGLGGWQTDAILVHPAAWPREDHLVGPDAVHRQLLRWLTDLGLRETTADQAQPAIPADLAESAAVSGRAVADLAGPAAGPADPAGPAADQGKASRGAAAGDGAAGGAPNPVRPSVVGSPSSRSE
jgi:hypothetical protein